jgi:rhodanese-related sulfurtransferase
MKKIISNKSGVLALTLVAFLWTAPVTAEGLRAVIPEDLIQRKLLQRDSSVLLTPDDLQQRLQHQRAVTLVDVRPPEEFERVRIPGSINVPLFAVKTKPFLRNRPLVLINGGAEWRTLEEECQRLNQNGFQAFALLGGIVAWRDKHSALEGNPSYTEDYRQMDVQTFYREKNYQDVLVLELSPEQSARAEKLLPFARPVSDAANIQKIWKESGSQYRTVILVGVPEITRQALAAADIGSLGPAFVLQGGVDAYGIYLERLTLSWRSREERLVQVGRCRECGPPREKSEDNSYVE